MTQEPISLSSPGAPVITAIVLGPISDNRPRSRLTNPRRDSSTNKKWRPDRFPALPVPANSSSSCYRGGVRMMMNSDIISCITNQGMPEIGGRFTHGLSRARLIWIINNVIVTGMYILFKAHNKFIMSREIYEMLLTDTIDFKVCFSDFICHTIAIKTAVSQLRRCC